MGYEGRHRGDEPTQISYPNRAMVRTIFQVGVPTLITLLIVIPEIIEITLEEYGDALPGQIRMWLLSASGVIVATAAIITRVMAIPSVNDLLTRKNIGAAPK